MEAGRLVSPELGDYAVWGDLGQRGRQVTIDAFELYRVAAILHGRDRSSAAETPDGRFHKSIELGRDWGRNRERGRTLHCGRSGRRMARCWVARLRGKTAARKVEVTMAYTISLADCGKRSSQDTMQLRNRTGIQHAGSQLVRPSPIGVFYGCNTYP